MQATLITHFLVPGALYGCGGSPGQTTRPKNTPPPQMWRKSAQTRGYYDPTALLGWSQFTNAIACVINTLEHEHIITMQSVSFLPSVCVRFVLTHGACVAGYALLSDLRGTRCLSRARG